MVTIASFSFSSLLLLLSVFFLSSTPLTPISRVRGQDCGDFGNCTTNVTKFYPQWKERTPSNVNDTSNNTTSLPDPRHSAVYVQAFLDPAVVPVAANTSGNVLIVFSGLNRKKYLDGEILPGMTPNDNYTVVGQVYYSLRLNDINLYDIDQNRWISNIETTGVRPYRRLNSAGVFHDNQLFIFGGDQQGQYLDNSTYVLDFLTLNWTEIRGSASTPSARYGHSAVRYEGNNRMYVFGGYSDLPNKAPTVLPDGSTITYPPPFFNELWVFDLETQSWLGQVPQVGDWPSPRTEHNAVIHGDSMYVWGGVFQPQCPSNGTCTFAGEEYYTELWRFDFLSNTWTLINVTGAPTPRRAAAASVDFFDNYILIFGGEYNLKFRNDMYKFYFETQSWEFIDTNYPACRPRYGHGIVPLPDNIRGRSGDVFLVTSGRIFDFFETNDVGELYTGPLSKLPFDPFETGETETAVLQFSTRAPTQAMVPIDDCGDRQEDNAVDVTFDALQEISYLDESTIVQKIDFANSFYEVDLAALYALDPNVNFDLSAGNGVSLSLNFTLFGQERTVDFANTTFKVRPSTNKWTFKIANWLFLDPRNKLQIKISLALRNGRHFSDIKSSYDRPNNLLSYTLFSKKLSFNVNLATVAIIDGTITPITHILKFDPDNQPDVDPELYFTFNQFQNSIDYDPDFSVTLGSGAQAGECGFAGWKIALIVLGITIPLLILAIAAGIVGGLWLKRKWNARALGNIKMVEFQLNDRGSEGSSPVSSPDASSGEEEDEAL